MKEVKMKTGRWQAAICATLNLTFGFFNVWKSQTAQKMNHDPSEMAAQLAAMQKLMAEQQATLEREREERRRKEAELDKLRFRADSSLDSVNSSTKSSTELNEVDALRRQLMAREQELREKEEQIREKDERLSVLSQRYKNNLISLTREKC